MQRRFLKNKYGGTSTSNYYPPSGLSPLFSSSIQNTLLNCSTLTPSHNYTATKLSSYFPSIDCSVTLILIVRMKIIIGRDIPEFFFLKKWDVQFKARSKILRLRYFLFLSKYILQIRSSRYE